MLEIIALWVLCKKIGTIVNDKGRKSGGYIALTIAFWIGGEIIGAVIGASIAYATDSGNCIVYAVALLGAAAGAGIAYAIARAASDVSPAYEPLQVAPPAPPLPASYELPATTPTYGLAPAGPATARSDTGIEASGCPRCGYMVTPGDRFCPSCGSQLAGEDEPGK